MTLILLLQNLSGTPARLTPQLIKTQLDIKYIRVILTTLLLTNLSNSTIMAEQKELKVISWSCNGIRGKIHELSKLLDQQSPDIFCLCETKLDSSVSDNELTRDYTLYRRNRTDGLGRGGGVLIGLSNKCPFVVSRINVSHPGEIIALDLSICGYSFTIACYYRRPCIKQVEDIVNWYYDQTNPNIVMVGDFNLPDIDWNDSNRPVLKTTRETNLHQLFVDFIISNNLSQAINKPTHDKGNTLDLVVTNVTTTNPRVESSCSDHFIINFNVLVDNVIKRTASLTKPKPYWQFEKADITNITVDCYSLHCKITSDISKKCSAEQL
ncbi:hypothetical protein EB796_015168 [Bugula neritina]|uniref:Endonuclease/exonuclease/phosphatase domain-containing protein n=1 Tax=Bugula neritina TaxID=10212 RepID=A0A7J7JK70_BUGNE|nr:hypothetical protein EB796_015168 [Bugula neritina]